MGVDDFYVFRHFRFLRIKKIEMTLHKPGPTFWLAELDATDPKKEKSEPQPYLLDNLENRLFRISPFTSLR